MGHINKYRWFPPSSHPWGYTFHIFTCHSTKDRLRCIFWIISLDRCFHSSKVALHQAFSIDSLLACIHFRRYLLSILLQELEIALFQLWIFTLFSYSWASLLALPLQHLPTRRQSLLPSRLLLLCNLLLPQSSHCIIRIIIPLLPQMHPKFHTGLLLPIPLSFPWFSWTANPFCPWFAPTHKEEFHLHQLLFRW